MHLFCETGSFGFPQFPFLHFIYKRAFAGCLTLLEILEIYGNYFFSPGNLLGIYKVSGKFFWFSLHICS